MSSKLCILENVLASSKGMFLSVIQTSPWWSHYISNANSFRHWLTFSVWLPLPWLTSMSVLGCHWHNSTRFLHNISLAFRDLTTLLVPREYNQSIIKGLLMNFLILNIYFMVIDVNCKSFKYSISNDDSYKLPLRNLINLFRKKNCYIFKS